MFDLAPLWVSLKTALAATLLAVGLGTVAARWTLGLSGRMRGLVEGVLTLPLVLPPTVTGFLLLAVLGPVGRSLNISLLFSWSAIVLAAAVVALPLAYRSVLAAFEQVDPTLLGAARSLGANEIKVFWRILLPLAWPGLLSGTLLAFARSLGEFGATLMVGGSIPGRTLTVPIAIFFATESGQSKQALAWVLLMVTVSLAVAIGVRPEKRFNSGPPSPVGRRDWGMRACSNVKNQDLLSINGETQHQRTALTVNIQKHLSDFTLQVQFETGTTPLGILGASGSGKSLTLRCIAGLESPSQGRIALNGRVLFDSAKKINLPCRDRRVGLVFQNYALFPHLTVAQNIAFGIRQGTETRARIDSWLARLELMGLGDRYPQQLSGGQQQRVALARALAAQPDVLLLDEPLSALDTYLRSQVEKQLAETLANYSGSTLFVTHKLEEAYRVCPRLLVLENGQVLANNSREEIFHHPPSLAVARVTECKNFSAARRLGGDRAEAIDWTCSLRLLSSPPEEIFYLGIRAHHIGFPSGLDLPNTFLGWPALVSKTQHRVTLYLKLQTAPSCSTDYHLQAEVYREKWTRLRQSSPPWPVQLAAEHLIVMTQ